MTSNSAEQIDRAIDRREVTMVFQPIVDLRCGEPLGAEALLRPLDTGAFPTVTDLLDAAARHGRLSELEAIARGLSFETFFGSDRLGLLFMNNSPAVMSEAGFVDSIVDAMSQVPGFDPARVVLEITERAGFSDFEQLSRQTVRLRDLGFQIALDDVGAGLSGLNRIMSLRPDWVKLDRDLVANLDRQPLQENMLRSLVHFARLSNMAMVAEGIERYEELQTLVEMGVGAGQGYFLARPDAAVHTVDEDVQRTVVSLHRRATARWGADATTVRIASLARTVPTFDVDTTCTQAWAALKDIAGAPWVVALGGRRFLGLIARETIEEAAESGRTHLPLIELPRRDGCALGADTTLAEALATLASRSDDRLGEPVIVQRNGLVVGCVPTRQLLQAAADAHRLSRSRMAGLTGLPTRLEADQWLADRIRAGDLHDVAFIDLRDFDAYNLAYGFDKGDAMLLRLIWLLRRVAAQSPPGETLLAHLGEDRFLLATRNDSRTAVQQLVDEFATDNVAAFTHVDRARGCFHLAGESGEPQKFPLTTVRAVYLARPLPGVSTPQELHDMATQLRRADRDDAGGLVTERRGARAISRSA